ncbi:hypothetical protein BaRGS_00011565 [Batillaria attramentaria]|uniref:Uncharacterized protein n=1 Tax=Batillaria attramentaria TaxID=370345 RepID=A0ABD0LD40_9CAEN
MFYGGCFSFFSGETAANKDMIIQGHTDVPLSDKGLEQARLVASRLKHEHFTHIFASDLKRASQTAQAIAEANTACSCSVRLDSRLRERKFGVFEGRTFKDLTAAAKNSKVHWADFTPDGAETFQNVRDRARQFFRELCELMEHEGSTVDGEYRPASIKAKRQLDAGVSNGSTEREPEAPRISISQNNAECTINHRQSSECKTELQNLNHGSSLASHRQHPCPVEEDIASKRPRTGTDSQLPMVAEIDQVLGVMPADLSPSSMARSNSLSSSSGCSSLQDSVECQEADPDLPTPTEEYERDTDSNDTGFGRPRSLGRGGQDLPTNRAVKNFESVCIISQDRGGASSSVDCLHYTHVDNGRPEFCLPAVQLFDGANQNWVCDRDSEATPVFTSSQAHSQQMCPNVSLSPLLEHRISSISSVSSGRNSSFDDADIIPMAAGEVLVVSHGGLLKELVTHFIEDFQCKVPGGKSHALRICPNTGVSRFMVTLSEPDFKPTVTCLFIHDKDHLRSMSDVQIPLGV